MRVCAALTPSNERTYRLSPLAERDLEDIWQYTCRTWSPEQADTYHGTIIAAVEGLALGTKIGRDASDVRKGYRKPSTGRHILFYREDGVRVDVIRILHHRMDVTAHLGAMNS